MELRLCVKVLFSLLPKTGKFCSVGWVFSRNSRNLNERLGEGACSINLFRKKIHRHEQMVRIFGFNLGGGTAMKSIPVSFFIVLNLLESSFPLFEFNFNPNQSQK